MLPPAVRRLIPSRARRFIRRLVGVTPEDPTTTEGWEQYARNVIRRGDRRLGEEWNEPQAIGVDVPPEEIPQYIDRAIIGPFLGTRDAILEIGAGGGRWTELLLARSRCVIAGDTSPSMLDLLRARLGSPPSLETVLLDGRGLGPIADASVDAVFSYDVFVHLPHWDIFNYLREIHRVLRPGGRALIHHGHVLSELGWKNFLEEIPSTVNRHTPFGNFSVMTPDLMREFATRAGLICDALRTDIVRRDCMACLRKSA